MPNDDLMCYCGHSLSQHHDHIMYCDDHEAWREYQTCDQKYLGQGKYGCGCDGFSARDDAEEEETGELVDVA